MLMRINLQKRIQEAAEIYLEQGRLIYRWLPLDEHHVCLILEGDENDIVKLMVQLVWQQEQKQFLDWAEQILGHSVSRWEKIKFRESIREQLADNPMILYRPMIKDLKQIDYRDDGALDITGFVRFAAVHLRKKVAELVWEWQLALQEEKEREDFVLMLQSFVAMQEPVVVIADVFWSDKGFEVKDEKGSDLKSVYRTSMLLERIEMTEETIPEDFLLSILITVVPAKVVIHLTDVYHKGALDMVARVFADRLVWCTGCDVCR